MKNIFAHIAGVNLESKELIKKSFSKKIFEIIFLSLAFKVMFGTETNSCCTAGQFCSAQI